VNAHLAMSPTQRFSNSGRVPITTIKHRHPFGPLKRKSLDILEGKLTTDDFLNFVKWCVATTSALEFHIESVAQRPRPILFTFKIGTLAEPQPNCAHAGVENALGIEVGRVASEPQPKVNAVNHNRQ